MYRRFLIFAVTVLIPFVFAGCAGSASSGDGSARAFRANLGTATLYDFNQKTRAILNKYRFIVVRHESTTDLTFYETEWKSRYPFQDELDEGIEQARTRITIQATPRTRAAIGGDLNTVRFEAENQVFLRGTVDWRYVEMSDMLKAFLREVSDDLATEFRAGIRRY